MADLEINKDTPIDAVKDNRAHLVRLARTVFDRMETGAMRAFSQFQKSGEIVRLIEAKRAGVFDYSTHVVQTPTGWTWPSTDDALKMLDASEKGGAVQTKEEPAPVQQVQQEAPKQTPSRRAEPAAEKKANGVATVERDATSITGPIRESIEGLRDDLRDAFMKLDGRTDERFTSISARLHGIGRGCMGLVGAIEVLMARQKVIAQYLDEHAELPELSDEMKKDLVQFAGDADVQVTEKPFEAPVQQHAKPSQEQKQEPAPQVAKQQAAPVEHTGFNYTKDQLTEIGNKDIAQLRAIAESVGVPNVNAIPFVGVLVARIESFRQKAARA